MCLSLTLILETKCVSLALVSESGCVSLALGSVIKCFFPWLRFQVLGVFRVKVLRVFLDWHFYPAITTRKLEMDF